MIEKRASRNLFYLLFVMLMIASLGLSACTTVATPEATATMELIPEEPPTEISKEYSGLPFVGKTWFWLSTQFNNETQTIVVDPARYSIQFNADGTLNGKADCNMFNGSYSASDSSIAIGMGATTLAACPPDSQSDEFLRTLGEAVIYFIQDGYLYFDLKVDTGTMKLGEQPTPVSTGVDFSTSPLVGKVWQWGRLDMSDGSVTQTPLPASYSLEFLADGAIQGVADCNTLMGTYTVTDASLAIQAAQKTRVACSPGSLADQFVQRINETATYVIADGMLVLNLTMDSGNMVFAQAALADLPAPAEGSPSAQAIRYAGVYGGPGLNFPVAGIMPVGGQAEVVGKSQDSAWWAVSMPTVPTGRAWVSAENVVTAAAENVQPIPEPPAPPAIALSAPVETDPQVKILETVYARSGPGVGYPAYGAILGGTEGVVVGRSQDNNWWVVRVDPSLVNSGNVWIATNYTLSANVSQVVAVETPAMPDQVVLPTPPSGAASGVVMTAVNVRSGPAATFPVLGAAPAGSVGEITGKSADNLWWQMRLPAGISSDGFGWVNAGFVLPSNAQNAPVVGAPAPTQVLPVSPVATPAGTPSAGGGGSVRVGTTTEPVNVYNGPGKQYDSVGVLPAGYTGRVVETSPDGKWVAFAMPISVVSSGKGWVNAAYVSIRTVSAATATAMVTARPPVITTPEPSGTPGATPVAASCKVTELEPANGTVFKPNADFDMKVVCKNTGTTDWDPSKVDIQFIVAVDGVKIHQGNDVYDLPELVEQGDSVTIYLDMLAPSDEGSYGETWALVEGNKIICQWSFSIKVAKP